MDPQPRSPSRRAWWPLILAALVLGAGIGGGAIWWIEAQDQRGLPPRDYQQPDAEGELARGTEAAQAHMETIAEAMRRYRAEFGDNVRWPVILDDLKQLRLLEPDFNFIGLLSRRPVAYSPDLPLGHDPARWAICCDVQVGWRYERRRGSVRAPVGAVVIMGDGQVRTLGPEDLDSVGGLVFDLAAAR